jgi:hypothetical protein
MAEHRHAVPTPSFYNFKGCLILHGELATGQENLERERRRHVCQQRRCDAVKSSSYLTGFTKDQETTRIADRDQALQSLAAFTRLSWRMFHEACEFIFQPVQSSQ